MTTTQLVVLAGEIRWRGVYEDGQWAPGALEEIEKTVRNTVRAIGYEQDGFPWETFPSSNNNLQVPVGGISPRASMRAGNKDEGAGDQGISVRLCRQRHPDLMPATLYYSHKILEQMAADRHSRQGAVPRARRQEPGDLALRGQQAGRLHRGRRLDQHAPGYDQGEKEAELHAYVKAVVAEVIPAALLSDETELSTSTRPAASRSAGPTATPA